MGKIEKTLERVLRGTSDSNIDFKELCSLLRYLGFRERIKGSHHIFSRAGVLEIFNLQPIKNNAKAYQVKQVRQVVLEYNLTDLTDV